MVTFLSRWCGAVAQLGARLDGIEEVVGSNPIGSTKYSRCLCGHLNGTENQFVWARVAGVLGEYFGRCVFISDFLLQPQQKRRTEAPP